MKHVKLNLKQLNVRSFVTEIDHAALQGGQTFLGCGPTQLYPPCNPSDTNECPPALFEENTANAWG